MRRARARRRRAARAGRPNETLELARRLASPVGALIGGIAALLIVALRLGGGWIDALSTGASVAFLTFLAVEVPNMVLNEYRVRSEREAREREREARLAAETRAAAAESRAEAAQRRSDRLAAALAAALKDKGVDPDVLDALLEE